MIRKYSRILFLTMLSFFIAMPFSKAVEVDIETIGEAIDSVNTTTQSVYVIGEYIFTTGHTLTTQDMMLAAKSIHLKDTVGKTNQDDVFNEMAIFKLEREFDENDEPTGKWKILSNYIGSSEFPENLTIRYVDYNKVLNKYRITLRYNSGATPNGTLEVKEGVVPTEPEEPQREGYVFDGWYLNGEPFEFKEPIDEDITLDAHWKKAVDFEELLDLGSTILDNEEFGASFENDVFNIQVKNKYRKIEDADLKGLITLINNLLRNDEVTSVVLNYNNTDYIFTSEMTDEEKQGKVESLLEALSSTEPIARVSLAPMSVDSDARFSSTLEKVFTISVTLKDDAALTENSKTIYSVKFISDAKDAEVETDLQAGFKGETSEFTVTVKANDYANEKIHLNILLPQDSYENLQYCETPHSCEAWDGTKELTLEDKVYSFKVTWKTTEEVEYTISIIDALDETITYATKTGSLTNKEKFTVTFDYADGVTDEKTEEVVSGEVVSTPDEPTREHYDFEGWYKGEEKYTFETPVTSDLKLTAKWKGKTYTATFTGEGLDTSKYPKQTVTYPEKATKPTETPVRAEHTFSGWFVDGVEFDFNEPLTKDVIIEAKWDIVKYKVEFYDDQGSISKTENVESGSSVQAPELSKKGYKLSWHKDSQDGDLYDLKTPVTGNLKLYAKFEPIKYTFEYKGDAITEPSKEYTYPALPEEPKVPEREGYTFLGWYLGDATEKYDFKKEILEEGTVTLTGKWEANVYRVTYECEGCNGSVPAAQEFTYPNKPSKPTLKPTKAGFDFLYWYDSTDDNEEEYDFENQKLLKDLTLVAKFDVHKYEIKFQACSETDKACKEDTISDIPETLKVGYNEFVEDPKSVPTREGYDFLGWYTQYPTVSEIPFDFSGTKITKNYTLIAKWKKKVYTVTFKANGTEINKINSVEHGETIADRLKDSDMSGFVLSPYSEGHRFDHWYLETDDKKANYEFTTPVTSDITLVAEFVPVVDIDNLISDAALKLKNGSFLSSFVNNTVIINVDDGEGEHATAHNDDNIKDLVDGDTASVAKTIKELVDNDNIESVIMSYDNKDYTFTGDDNAIKATLVGLLTAIVEKNGGTYETATLNELIENDYSANPLTLKITLKSVVETVDGQSSSATYNVKVVSDVITVTNETELKNALNGTYESIKIGNDFDVTGTITINRSVSIFGKNNTIEITKEDADAIFDIRYNSIGGTTVNIKNLTLKGGKKGIYVPDASTFLSIMNVKFEDNTDMAMEIYGKLHADGDELSYNLEDYNHPFVRTSRKNAVTGGTYTTAKETGNISIHKASLDYEYDIIHKYSDKVYTEDDFKARDWSTGTATIYDYYCEECQDGDPQKLKEEYQKMIGQPDINHSDSLEKTDWAHYYLDEVHSQYHTVVFRDTPSGALVWRYVLDGETAVMPGEPLPTYYFKSFARMRSVKVRNEDGTLSDEPANFALLGWSNDSKGTTGDYPLEDIKNVKESRYYYTHYKKVDDIQAVIQAMSPLYSVIQ